MRGLLDTSVVIDLTDIDQAHLPDEPEISAITLAELSVGPLVAPDPTRARRLRTLLEAEAAFDALPFDAASARVFGQVSASLRAAGQKTSARAYDALIAATAIANDLPLYTRNPRDFAAIDGLTVVEVPLPA